MATRPAKLPSNLWEKMSQSGREYVHNNWDSMSDDDKTLVCSDDTSPSDAIDLLLADMPDEDDSDPKPSPETVNEPTVKVADMPPDIQKYFASQEAKVTEEVRSEFVNTIEMDIKAQRKRQALFITLDKAGLDLPRYDAKPDPTSNSEAGKLGDVYYEQRTSKKGERLPDATRHRLHDLADQLFGKAWCDKVAKLEAMGDEAISEYGQAKYAEDIDDAKTHRAKCRRCFSDAATALVAYRAINGLPGIQLNMLTNSKGEFNSNVPFQLVELIDQGEGKQPKVGRVAVPVGLSELERYQPDIAFKRLELGDKEGGSKTMYDAIRASKPPKKPRGTGSGNQGRAANSAAGAATGNDVHIKNLMQFDSGIADVAALIDLDPGFRGEVLKHINQPADDSNDFLLSLFKTYRFLDYIFGTGAIKKRAGELLEAEAKAEADKLANKAAA